MIEHDPWVGPEYQRGFAGQRITIVGYSHWRGNDTEGRDFTNRVVLKVMRGEPFHFFEQIRKYFNEKSPEEMWRNVMFFNYLPDWVGGGDERFSQGTTTQIKRAQERFLRLIFKERPNKVLVFSRKAWSKFPPSNYRGPLQHFPKVLWGTYSSDGHTAMVFCLRHPQGACQEDMRRAVKHILAMPLV